MQKRDVNIHARFHTAASQQARLAEELKEVAPKLANDKYAKHSRHR